MSVNRHRPHVLVLPEDRANRQLANGFCSYEVLAARQIQVLAEAGGWTSVLEHFLSDHADGMQHSAFCFMVLLIDFDGREERLRNAKARIPGHLTDRVFILGSWTEPEDLKADLGSYESIGLKLAEDCHRGTGKTWGHNLLRHNAGELDRLRTHVRPILFPSA